ncbi:putative cell surface [Golovinomyces cichoracearum]|uniref:Putative cell surface n=1 Tax=Golovinomyces cichoracearum TaxID=62708 RepID=A0A420J252_9PEZI|nr:putative cell surface [Golovinomyces cichoracearum]
MSSTVNKIKDALHIGNDEHEKGRNQSGIPHPRKSLDPDGLNSSQYSRAKAAAGHDTLSGTSTGAGNENLPGTVLDYSTGQVFNPGDIRGSYDETAVDQHPSSRYATQSQGNLGDVYGPISTKLGNIPHSSNTEHHRSGVLNKLDPRVEFDSSERRDNHSRNHGGVSRAFGDTSTTGFGNESQNSGLRSNDFTDKLDPRIHTHRHQSRDVDGSGKFS